MRIVILGGAGIIGRAIGRDLASDRAVRELVVADLDLEQVAAARAKIPAWAGGRDFTGP